MTEREMVQRWARTWKEAGPELERIRLREVREEDTLVSLRLLAPSFEQAVRTCVPDGSHGMVEMQRLFTRLRQ